MAYAARGDSRAAGIWLRRIARDPSVSPWLLLDQLTAPEIGLPGCVQARTGESAVRLIAAAAPELAEPAVEGARTG